VLLRLFAVLAVLLPATSRAEQVVLASGSGSHLSLGGWAETAYQWNFNQPSNRITNFRSFDSRSDSFLLQNAAVDLVGGAGPMSLHLTLQFGLTGDSYYLAEPSLPGASGAAATSLEIWKHVQQAVLGYQAPLGRGLLVEGGLFLSPVGLESTSVKDDWNWSRSTLFFALPAYHTGLRLSYPLDDRVTVVGMVSNGWNSVVDGNDSKSVALYADYFVTERITAQVLYFGGVERPRGAPEGKPWRNLFDVFAIWQATPALGLAFQADAGFEDGRLGTSSWEAGAVYVRVQPASWLYLSGRADVFVEQVGTSPRGAASSIFYPTGRVVSGTLTADLRPHPQLSLRTEYRHDAATSPIYFRGSVPMDDAGAFVSNAGAQDTVTEGLVAWF
jgi:hypothetical protein